MGGAVSAYGRDNLYTEGGEVTTTTRLLLSRPKQDNTTLSAGELPLADTRCFLQADTPAEVSNHSAR